MMCFASVWMSIQRVQKGSESSVVAHELHNDLSELAWLVDVRHALAPRTSHSSEHMTWRACERVAKRLESMRRSQRFESLGNVGVDISASEETQDVL